MHAWPVALVMRRAETSTLSTSFEQSAHELRFTFERCRADPSYISSNTKTIEQIRNQNKEGVKVMTNSQQEDVDRTAPPPSMGNGRPQRCDQPHPKQPMYANVLMPCLKFPRVGVAWLMEGQRAASQISNMNRISAERWQGPTNGDETVDQHPDWAEERLQYERWNCDHKTILDKEFSPYIWTLGK